MRIVTLLENESSSKSLKSAHGLSLFIETNNHRILFDVGPNKYFIKNAVKLGIDLTTIDMVIISHGHNDHGSGLAKFMKINSKAKIYLSPDATKEHVKRKGNDHINVGLKEPKQQERLVYVDDDIVVDNEITIVANVPFVEQVIQDETLYMYENGRYQPDDFAHEIYLLIQEEDNLGLFTGCSHKGIENIIDSIEAKLKTHITHIFGGYHFQQYNSFNFKETDYLAHLGKKFNRRENSTFYSCHCTGNDAFYELKIHLRDNLLRIKTGDTVII